MKINRHIFPHILLGLRLALAPVVVMLAYLSANRSWFILVLVIGILSDIFDGIVARRLHVATEFLRRADSIVDVVFYLGVIWAALLLHAPVFIQVWLPIFFLTLFKIVRFLFEYYKFRRETAYHMWSAKVWGIMMFAAFCEIFWRGQANIWFWAAIVTGLLNNLESLLASIVLPAWHHDVFTIYHAWHIRAGSSQTKS